MPLEVNEIGIHMRVGDAADQANQRSKDNKRIDPCGQSNLEEEEREGIVQDCVRRVLQTLQSRQLR